MNSCSTLTLFVWTSDLSAEWRISMQTAVQINIKMKQECVGMNIQWENTRGLDISMVSYLDHPCDMR